MLLMQEMSPQGSCPTRCVALGTRVSLLRTYYSRWLLALVLAISLSTAAPIHAQAPAEPATADAESTAEEVVSTPTLDLGSFKINDLRPTRNETARLTFTLHLAFSKELTDQHIAQLENWKHRLRDQVITAVRISEMKDFQEPDLDKLRRRILIRVSRLLKTKLVEEVLVTKYLIRLY
ncbi:MAG: flagellar basal body-associated FliL family protein [Bythopirellula sp.]